MHKILSRLVVYRMTDNDSILNQLAEVCRLFESGQYNREDLISRVLLQINRLLLLSTQYGFDHNLWHNYLAFLLAVTETPFSLVYEKAAKQKGTVNTLATRDFLLFKKLFDYDFSKLEEALGLDCFSMISHYQAVKKDQSRYNAEVSEKIKELSEAIGQAQNEQTIFQIVTGFYRRHGVGLLGLNRAFYVRSNGSVPVLEPITNAVDVRLKDLIGYEHQKQQLIANTEAFIYGGKANNLLLYGDSGTGKSTCVKAILNEYHQEGLRIIEIYKHQLKDLPAVISMIKNRNYRFIIFMDDLSFEDFETDFLYLKAIIEGGIEVTPDNVLIYATSNRRHLIRETWADRNESSDIHYSDTAEEKISLFNRFGVTIRFDRPNREEYLSIVYGLAAQYPQIQLTKDEIAEQALRWATWHGSFSGRRARQFINDLLGQSVLENQSLPGNTEAFSG